MQAMMDQWDILFNSLRRPVDETKLFLLVFRVRRKLGQAISLVLKALLKVAVLWLPHDIGMYQHVYHHCRALESGPKMKSECQWLQRYLDYWWWLIITKCGHHLTVLQNSVWNHVIGFRPRFQDHRTCQQIRDDLRCNCDENELTAMTALICLASKVERPQSSPCPYAELSCKCGNRWRSSLQVDDKYCEIIMISRHHDNQFASASEAQLWVHSKHIFYCRLCWHTNEK